MYLEFAFWLPTLTLLCYSAHTITVAYFEFCLLFSYSACLIS